MRISKKILTIAAVMLCVIALWACGEKKENKDSDFGVKPIITTTEEITTEEKTTEETTTEEKTTEETTSKVEKIKVKDVVGKSADNAEAILKGQGFEIYVESEFSNEVEEGYVISQSPSADNDLSLEKGDIVTITVSKGKEPIEAKYLDSIVYADYISGSPFNKMSAYEGIDRHGNACTRAIKFYCDATEDKQNTEDLEQTVKVTYLIEEGIKTFSSIVTPLSFPSSSFQYIHVNLYKDDVLLYSMDISGDTNPLDLKFDIEGADTFTIELKYLTSFYDVNASIVFSEAKFQ